MNLRGLALLFGILVIVSSVISSSAYAVSWQVPDYAYRMPVYVNQTGSGTIDVPVLLNGTSGIDTQTLISDGKLDPLGNCVKVYDENDNRIEWHYHSGVNTPNTLIWANPTIPVAGNIVYLYYDSYCATGDTDNEQAVYNTDYNLAYHFNEETGSTVYDSTSNNYDGTITGAVWNSSGVSDYSLQFDGTDDHVVVGDVDGGSSTITVMAWVNSDGVQGGVNIALAKKESSYSLQTWNEGDGKSTVGFEINALQHCTTGIALDDIGGTWHHFAGTFNGSTILCYYDGVEVGNYSYSASITNNANSLWLGERSNGAEDYTGRLDEVYVLNTVLSADEIKRFYEMEQSTAQAEEDEPFGYPLRFDMDDVDGNNNNTVGYASVINATLYDPLIGFGFNPTCQPSGDAERSGNPVLDSLNADFVYGGNCGGTPAYSDYLEFIVDLPNGMYNVSLLTGDLSFAQHPMYMVMQDGRNISIPQHGGVNFLWTHANNTVVYNNQMFINLTVHNPPTHNWARMNAIVIELQELFTWFDPNYLMCKNITITENSGNDVIDQEIYYNLTGLNFTSTDEVRIVNAPCNQGGSEITRDIISNTTDSVYALFMADLKASTDTVYSVYYNNPYVSPPTYTDLVTKTTDCTASDCVISVTSSLHTFEYPVEYNTGMIYTPKITDSQNIGLDDTTGGYELWQLYGGGGVGWIFSNGITTTSCEAVEDGNLYVKVNCEATGGDYLNYTFHANNKVVLDTTVVSSNGGSIRISQNDYNDQYGYNGTARHTAGNYFRGNSDEVQMLVPYNDSSVDFWTYVWNATIDWTNHTGFGADFEDIGRDYAFGYELGNGNMESAFYFSVNGDYLKNVTQVSDMYHDMFNVDPSVSLGSEEDLLARYSNETAIDVSVASGSTIAGYQMLFNITKEPEMNADYSDLLFLDGNKTEYLPFWIQNMYSDYAEVWVKIDQPITTIPYTIYMKYGDPDAVSFATGYLTFLIFDDFELADDIGWSDGFKSGTCLENVEVFGGSYIYNITSGTANSECSRATSGTVPSRDYVLELDLYVDDQLGGTSYGARIGNHEDNNNWFITNYDTSIDEIRTGSARTGWTGWTTINSFPNPSLIEDAWYHTKLIKTQAGTNTSIWLSSGKGNNNMNYQGMSQNVNHDVNGSVLLQAGRVMGNYFDNIFVREYHDPEPTYVIGAVPQLNTTIPSIRFNITDFSFSSDNYTTALNVTFNTTAPETTMLFVSSFNVKAETGNTTRDVYARVIVDGTTEIDQKVRSIAGALDEGSTGIDPILFNVSTGEHYLQVDVRRTGSDSVSINDFDAVLVRINATGENIIRFQLTDVNYTHSSTSYTPEFNWSIDTYYFGKFTVSTDAPAGSDVFYYFENLNTSATSPIWGRALADENDTGSMSGIWLEQNGGEYNHTIMSKTSAGNVTVTGRITEFDTTTIDNKTINSFQTSNPSTDVDNYLTYTEGTYNIVNYSAHNYEGDSYFVAGMVTLNASGESTPAIKINSTQLSEANCYSKKERYMSDASDIGNAYIYTVCEGLSTGSDYEFNLWLIVPANVSVYLLDESFSGYEASEFNITEGYLPPIQNTVLTPVGEEYYKQTLSITWLEFADPNDDLSHYNISLLNSDSSYNQTINGSTTLLSQDFDTSTVDDGSYKVQVEAEDGQGLTASTIVDFYIDNTPPTITINDPQNTTYDIVVFATEYAVDLDISIDENVTNMTYSLNGGSNISFATDVDSFVGYITVPEGDNYLMICGTDYAGNENCSDVYFELILGGQTERTLADAGAGMGGFLSGLNQPLVDIILSLGFVGGILALVYGLASVLKGFFGKVAMG